MSISSTSSATFPTSPITTTSVANDATTGIANTETALNPQLTNLTSSDDAGLTNAEQIQAEQALLQNTTLLGSNALNGTAQTMETISKRLASV